MCTPRRQRRRTPLSGLPLQTRNYAYTQRYDRSGALTTSSRALEGNHTRPCNIIIVTAFFSSLFDHFSRAHHLLRFDTSAGTFPEADFNTLFFSFPSSVALPALGFQQKEEEKYLRNRLATTTVPSSSSNGLVRQQPSSHHHSAPSVCSRPVCFIASSLFSLFSISLTPLLTQTGRGKG